VTHAERFDIEYDGKLIRLSVKSRMVSDDLVVLLHGFGCAKECFDDAFVAEGLQDLSICTFDFPGHGDSERSNASVYSLQSYADITNILLEKLSPKKVSMVCHSMGGAVGLIATQERNDVTMFVNVEGNLVASDCGIVSRSTASQSFNTFKRSGYRKFLQDLRRSGRKPDKAWARWYAQADPCALHETAMSLVEWSDSNKLLALFKSLHGRAYIYGENEIKDYLIADLQDVSSYRIPDAGHFVMLDNPDAFYPLVSELVHRDTGVASTTEVDVLLRAL
jgi:pimeloyl-ACP methyl ester carboxylesterase